MDWQEIRLRLYRIIPIDWFDSRYDFIRTKVGEEAKLDFAGWTVTTGTDSRSWSDFSEYVIRVAGASSATELAPVWRSWYRVNHNGEPPHDGEPICALFAGERGPQGRGMMSPRVGVWFDFLAFIKNPMAYAEELGRGHRLESTDISHHEGHDPEVQSAYDELVQTYKTDHLLPVSAWMMAQDKYTSDIEIPVRELFEVFWNAYGPLLDIMTEEGTRDSIWQEDLGTMLSDGKYEALVDLINAKLEELNQE